MSAEEATLPFDAMPSGVSRAVPRIVWVVASVLTFTVAWTLFHAIVHGGRAINDDTAEAYVWGQQFEWGYWKHPPFWAWVAGAWFDVFPRNVWSQALLASVSAAVGLTGTWKLVGCFLRGDERISATSLLLLTPLYTFLAFTYNANSIFIPLWPWTAYFFVRAIDRRSVSASVLFGVMVGIDTLSKYYAALLIVTCVCAAFVHPASKAYLRSMLPWLSAAIAAALFAPHVLWLVHSGFPTFHYFGHETGLGAGFVVRQVLALLGECVAYNIAAAAFVMIVTRSSPAECLSRLRAKASDSRFRFLAVLALVPTLLTIACSVLLRVNISSNTLIGVFCLMPVLFLDLAKPHDPVRLRRQSLIAVGALTLVSLLVSPVFAHMGTRDFSATRMIAEDLDTLWSQNAHTRLRYVSGAEPYSEKMAFYLPQRPQEFILYKFADAPWVTPASLARNGFAAVCRSNDQQCITNARKFAPAKVFEKTIVPSNGRRATAFKLIVAPPKEPT